jgi:aspartate aminotransferase
MTGWRIGFALAPTDVIEAMGTLQGQSTTNAAAVSQAAAVAALQGPTEELERMRQEFDKRRLYMVKALRAIQGVRCVEPKGAFYAFPDVSSFVGKKTPQGRVIENDLTICEYLIEEAKVAVVPGSAFYAPGYIRLSYATSQAAIEKGISRIAAALGLLK